ncbi:MAG: glycosyltransferase, partial [Lachnospiraceae bacterium]|nr:glycosyltransferase [Lachnospiraceae bacterium]
TCPDMEILLIDDGSTDGCAAICKEFASSDSRVVYIRQENKGLIGARRTGAEQASGEFLMYVDSDDWIDQGMAEFLVQQIGDADMATTGVHYETGPGMVVEYRDQYSEGEYGGSDKEFLLKTMLYDMDSDILQRLTPWIWNKLYRTEIVRQVYRNLDADNNFAEDGVFLYNYLIISGAVRICHKCFYHYRYRTDSMFHGGNPHMLSDINKAYLALIHGFEKHPLKENLVPQLQRWVSVTAIMAVNGGMGFASAIHIPEFQLDTEGLRDKRIVLYGAGKAGRDYFRQLTKMGYHVVLWVDSNSSEIENVRKPSDIPGIEYDVILLAVSRPEYVDSIRQSLSDIGIGEEKLMWKKPIRTI